jgi:hypothetical protein
VMISNVRRDNEVHSSIQGSFFCSVIVSQEI